jgi:exosortase
MIEPMGATNGQLAAEAHAEQPAAGWRPALKAAIPLLLFAVVAAGPFYRVWFRWTNEEDYYSHGPLIPFVCAYLVLRKRKELTGEDPPEVAPLYAWGVGALVLYFVFSEFEWDKRWLFALLAGGAAAYLVHNLRALKPEPWKPGLALLLPALVLCVITGASEIVSLGWFFTVLTAIGMVLYYLGKRTALVIAFPLLFLLSSVPLPEYKIQEITMPLKKFATANTVLVLRNVLGIYCVRDGVKIEMVGGLDEEPKELVVGAVCSGLRSLIALISFGLLFAYITPLGKIKKGVLFAATIPASFIANLFRILTLSLVTYQWDAATATGDKLWNRMQNGPLSAMVPRFRKITEEPVHDITGILVFVIAFIALFGLERLLLRLEDRRARAAGPENAEPAARPEDGDE